MWLRDRRLLLLAALLIASASAQRDIPTNLRSLYDRIRSQRQCNNVLKGGFHSVRGDSGGFDYCGDHLSTDRIIYIQGKNGALANMDIDCDGVQGGPADDGRCGSSRDTQAQTTFRRTVEGYGTGQRDLDAHVHPYVVFGNEGTKEGWPTFNPRDHGIRPLSVMAVVCGDKLVYGIWGDTNGDDGPQAMVGEASISLATACFGSGVNGNSGHDANDVLYVAFAGEDAVPGRSGARWNAANSTDFQESIAGLGDRLVQRIGTGTGANGAARASDIRLGWCMAGILTALMLSIS